MMAMKFKLTEILVKRNYAGRSIHIPKGMFLLPLFSLLLLAILVLSPGIRRSLNESVLKMYFDTSLETTEKCNIFSGKWVPHLEEPYYSNETCHHMTDGQNCLKNGRADRGFLRWRWKPHECDLPLFDATHFLKLVKGKSMVFVGDSIGRNQMDSLLCILNTVAHPEDVTERYASKMKGYSYVTRWFFADWNFTLGMLWSPFLVKSSEAYRLSKGNPANVPEKLYLDEADTEWTSRIEEFDYVIFSGGQWFFRPFTLIENGRLVGRQQCKNNTQADLYGYRMAFRTAFRTLINLRGFKGFTFLVTHSPKHYESGDWNTGGQCPRTTPVTTMEAKEAVHQFGIEELHQIEMEEFKAAQREYRKKGLGFSLMDITDAMLVRPDGHPNIHVKIENISDCLHWCLPGPVDTWNEFLLYMLKKLQNSHVIDI